MKCDELKPIKQGSVELGDYWVYDAEEVDAAIAELKAENKKLKASSEQIMNELFDKVLIYPNETVRLEDAYKLAVSLKNTKRALYKACSNWAKSERYTEATWHGDEHREALWAKVQDRCLKKVEEYK